jgi:anti-sigma regulatory factor (Ser/Thr protein kinase)
VKATLAGWGLASWIDTAVLIASELVSNAVEASVSVPVAVGVLVIRMCLIIDADVLTIECWDQAPGVPVLCFVPELADRGRGLAIIDDLTGGAWGSRPAIGQPGKCVWAQILLREL